MPIINLNSAKWEQQHRKHVEQYLAEIDALYDAAIAELIRLGVGYNYAPSGGKIFAFSQNKSRQKQAEQTLSSFSDKLKSIITAGVAAEWAFANDKTDSWVKTLFSDPKRGWMLHNLEALEAFQRRKSYGHTLSDRVWNYSKQLQQHIELSLSVGISEGRSAAAISRDVRSFLNEPDKLFRRVRDIFGELKPSKAAMVYHPGQGVYRSSYQNAMRMARTEINSAYRECDSVRWQQLDFIVGIEVKTSKTHAAWLAKDWYPRFKKGRAPLEICDAMEGKYPKSFKFIGWHPNCYSDDSEVLTINGWKLFKDVEDHDLILSLNPETKGLEWVNFIARQCYPYKGKMVRFFNRSLDCVVTPDHQMIYLNKADGAIRKCTASEYRMGKGGFYRGCVYNADEVSTITIGDKTFSFDAFCEFMGYYLSDGSTQRETGISIAQQEGEPARDAIAECIKKIGLTPHMHPYNITIFYAPLTRYLKQFGNAQSKYVPLEIINASPRQIKIFLDAFIMCDGHTKKIRSFVGNRGAVCAPKEGERMYFTTSERMAGNLSEMILKIGRRPSFYTQKIGITQKRDGSIIKSNYPCYRISECHATTATVFDSEYIDYDSFVYDLTLERNHIMYIRRKGKCFWGSNCRCYAVPIIANEGTEKDWWEDADNEVTEPPKGFTKWLSENEDRIERAQKKGTLPYWIAENKAFADIGDKNAGK